MPPGSASTNTAGSGGSPKISTRDGLARAENTGTPQEAPEAEAGAGQRIERVRAALEALPESQRAIVHLHRYEGLTFAEIARVLGTTEGAVKLRAFRAYERLRKQLRGAIEHEGSR